jgi:hypothetical protein
MKTWVYRRIIAGSRYSAVAIVFDLAMARDIILRMWHGRHGTPSQGRWRLVPAFLKFLSLKPIANIDFHWGSKSIPRAAQTIWETDTMLLFALLAFCLLAATERFFARRKPRRAGLPVGQNRQQRVPAGFRVGILSSFASLPSLHPPIRSLTYLSHTSRPANSPPYPDNYFFTVLELPPVTNAQSAVKVGVSHQIKKARKQWAEIGSGFFWPFGLCAISQRITFSVLGLAGFGLRWAMLLAEWFYIGC